MITNNLNRRQFLANLGAFCLGLSAPALAGAKPVLRVLKDPNCGCCGSWIDIMQRQGFDVRVQNGSSEALAHYKEANGIPPEMTSCHTGEVDGYLIEGHVPATDIHRLLAERPNAIGLSVPGMPFGSPGMGPENEREAYSVFLIKMDGSAEVFRHYAAA